MKQSAIRYWKTKLFKTKEDFDKWIERNKNRYQTEEIFVDNYYIGINYRKLLRINIQ